jgi:gluconate 5-dehydrogenase|tara:strand:+ start:908 stop:1792 length:885 start_codon:yes stop_codon:yes gene_type:complete
MTSYDPLFDISDKTIIVTGASSGLGATFAKFLAERKANVVLAARRIEKLNKLSSELSDMGLKSVAIACDVTKSSDVTNMFDIAETQFGRVDVIVNNAGQIAESGTVAEKITDEMFEETVQVNLVGLWYCCREAGQRMLLDGKGGSIINLSSVAGLNGMRGMPAAYQATKGAVATLTKSLAANWGDRGIRVNAIAPGWFPSQMTMAWVRKSIFKDHISSSSPMGRIGKPEELTGTLLLLASDASSFINGEIISVDGGINASVGLPFFTEEMFTYLEKAVPNNMAKRIFPDHATPS